MYAGALGDFEVFFLKFCYIIPCKKEENKSGKKADFCIYFTFLYLSQTNTDFDKKITWIYSLLCVHVQKMSGVF